jgi:lipopolysaccharide biosynthesis protein
MADEEDKPNKKARLICYYLPQFHQIHENDIWWGKGFTEWTNVARAKPLYRGHYQPRIPADLGFYDLRVPEVRIAQADLARTHGIEGFCYWHYWFAGKRLLERPFNEVLKSGEPRFPFCLGWANDSWTGVWHGAGDRVLMEQTYPGKEDEEAHFRAVAEAFSDDRYIRVNGKPVFLVYRPHEMPEPRRFTDHWRQLAEREGLKGIYFIGEDHTMQWHPEPHGFDAAVPHAPGLTFHKLITARLSKQNLFQKLGRMYGNNSRGPHLYFYEDFIKKAIHQRENSDYYPSILPNWDNTPRCGTQGYVLLNSTPELFRVHLRQAIREVENKEPDKRIIFVKSWNEWAEGNYLEPDMKFGTSYLEACRDETLSAETNILR